MPVLGPFHPVRLRPRRREPTPQTTEGLETIKPGELWVAYRTDDKPASFLENDTPAGFFVDLINDLGQRTGLKPSFVATDFASALPSVRNHLYDTAAMSVLVTDERKQVVGFTTAVSYNGAQMVSRKNAPLPTVGAATGKTVAVTRGSALITLLNADYPGVEVKEFPNIAASLNGLLAGDVAGLFTGLATATQLQRDHPELTLSEAVVSGEIAFPVASDHQRLLATLNTALAAAMEDGTYTRLRQKWNPEEPIAPQLLKDYPGMPATVSPSPSSK
jgi:ABC-type amino acid transport substrate-binding protein